MSEVLPAFPVSRGECLRGHLKWTDENGDPIDLTGRVLRIAEAYPRALEGGTVTVTDASAGEFEIFIPEAVMASAGRGRVNWLRLEMELPGGCPDTSERFWVEVA